MNLSFLGGAYEVGASCILLQLDNKNILLDCGIRQSSSKDILPDLRGIQEKGGVDAILLSHAHMDHTGALPIISKEYPSARLYMNNMTKDLIRVLLYDSLKIMNNRESEIPLYAEADVVNMLDRTITLNYQVEFEISEGIKATFYPAGHIAGASCIYISGNEGSLFYSGDFSIFPQKTVDGAKIPKLRPDAAIFESTYGDKLHSNREVEEERLLRIVEDCISHKGKMLIPAFAQGRAQEVLLILKKAMNNKRLKKVKVYVDGMVKDINRVYKLNPLYLKSSLGKKVLKGIEPFYDENIQAVANKEEREKLLNENECCIIISSSGMLTGGPSQYYAEKIASLENGYITVTGYQDEEAPGRKLLELLDKNEEDRVLEINNKTIPVKCKIEKVGLSAHGDKSEIKALAANLSPRNIFFVHGEGGIVESLCREVQREFVSRVYAPKCGESIELNIINPRKQLKKQLQYMLSNKEPINEAAMPELWSFVAQSYGDRFFTVEELLILWKGTAVISKEEIEKLQSLLADNIYFENDLRRFFMFKAKSAAEVAEALKPKELKANEITELASEYFAEYDFKKVSLMQEQKRLILNFDFPKTVPPSISAKINEFQSKTSWQAAINEQTNMNALDNVIRRIFDSSTVKKISHYLNENKVLVQLKCDKAQLSDDKYKADIGEFKEKTGFELILQCEGSSAEEIDKPDLFLSNSTVMLEQNQALSCIDQSFAAEEFEPYKKSIKAKGFIELAFISPTVGKRYLDKIKRLSEEIGWNIAISSSVNQNEIIALAARLCAEKGIALKKNPSFNPAKQEVAIKPDFADEDVLSEIRKSFEHSTGCPLIWV